MTCSKCGIPSAADPCPQCQRLLEDIRNAPEPRPRDLLVHIHHRKGVTS